MAVNYNNQGLDKYLNTTDSLAGGTNHRMGGFKFDALFEVQGKVARFSRSAIGTLIQLSNESDAVGTITNNTSVKVTATITPNSPYLNLINFCLPFVSVYAAPSAIGSLQIYPRYGSGIANKLYTITSGLDFVAYNGTNSVFQVNIENNSGSASPVFAQTQWKVLVYNIGTGV